MSRRLTTTQPACVMDGAQQAMGSGGAPDERRADPEPCADRGEERRAPQPRRPPGARAAAAPGRRQPLPPRHRRRRRLAGRRGRDRGGAAVSVARIVQIGCDLPGRTGRWSRAHARRAGRRVSRCTPTRRRGWPTPVSSTSALEEIERLAAGARPGARRRGDRARPLPHRRPRGGRRRTSRSAGTSTWPSGSTRRWSSTTATPTTTCSRCSTSEGVPERWVMHCFSGDDEFARQCLDRGAYLQLRRHGHVQERRAAARCARGHPAGPGAGRDRRAVPHADALPRPAQRVVPRPAHRAGDGGGARGRPRRAVRGGRPEHGERRSEEPGSPISRTRSYQESLRHSSVPHLGLANWQSPPGRPLWSS